MTTTQWDYFDENGQYRPDAESAFRLIRRVLEADPQNALAHHLHIHIAETARQTRCAKSGPGQCKFRWYCCLSREESDSTLG